MLKIPGQLENETLEDAVGRLLENPDTQVPLLSKDAIEALYAFGYGYYESGNYDKAMHFFRFLTLLDGKNRKHWMGLGAAYQMKRHYEPALECYAYASLQDESDPYAHWHAAECLSALNCKEQSTDALENAESTAKKNPKKYSVLLERIKLLKNNLA